MKPCQTELTLTGVHCAGCVGKIEKALALAHVGDVQVNLADRTVIIEGDVDPTVCIRAIESAGFGATLQTASTFERETLRPRDRRNYRYLLQHAMIATGFGLLLMVWGMTVGSMTVRSPADQLVQGVVGGLTLLLLIFSGRHYYSGAVTTLKGGGTNMDTLIALGTGIAWLYSMTVVLFPFQLPETARHVYFEASAMIIGLVNLGQALELRARGKTGRAIQRLLDLRPKVARVIRSGEELDLPVDQIAVGDLLRIRPGEKIAVDGTIIEGQSLVDEAMLTGEPVAIQKRVGDTIAAGTLNRRGTLVVRAEQVGGSTTLARIIELVKKAQSSKMPIARLADQISAVFVPVVIAVAVAAATVWYLLGPEPAVAHAFVILTTVLIIACPCALGLATPMSVMVSVGKAAELGLLVRKSDALQKASKLDTILLDKTGTITKGKPSVTDVFPLGDVECSEILQIAASVESSSEHPLSEAVVLKAGQESLTLKPCADFHAVTGQGVVGTVEGRPTLVGNALLMQHSGIDISPLEGRAEVVAAQAKTPVFVACDNRLMGLLAIADPIRPDSKAAIARLRKNSIRVMMLTGDNPVTAVAIAKEAGIDEQLVFAGASPEEKEAMVRRVKAESSTVGMMGDGINDAPALARADVGFAVGGGTDVAIESADITLLRPSLHGLVDAVELSRATLTNIKQNLLGAFAYNSLGIPIAAGVLYPFTGILLNPMVAGAAMALSSVTVVTNANRLRRFKPTSLISQF